MDEATWRGRQDDRAVEGGIAVTRWPVTRFRRPRLFHQATRIFFHLPPSIRPERAWLRAQGPYAPSLIRALEASASVPTLFGPYLYHPIVYGLPRARGPRILMPAAHDEPALHLHAVRTEVGESSALWYNTPEERDLVERVHPIAERKPSAIGAVGVDTARGGDASRFRARFGIEGQVLLYAGRATEGKGYPELRAGFAELVRRGSDSTLAVVGPQSEQDAAGVRHVGVLDSPGLRDAIAASAAVVVPGKLESLSMIALEAWAAGRPTLLNGESPVLRGQAERAGGQLLFTDSRSFADAAARILEDPDLARRLGAAGNAYVREHHQWDDVVARLQHLLALIAEAYESGHVPD